MVIFVSLILTDFIFGENPSCSSLHLNSKESVSVLFVTSSCLNCLPMPCRGSSCIHLPSTKSAGLEVSFYLLLLLYFFASVKSIFVFRLELLVCIPRLLPRSSTVTWLVSVWFFWSSSSDFVAPCLWRWKPQARKNSLRKILSCVVKYIFLTFFSPAF